MRILYKNKSVEKQFSSEYSRNWRYPQQVKKNLLMAENYIRNADSFQDLAAFHPFRLERLKGKRKDEWSIRIGGNTGYRVTLIPCDDKGEQIVDGDIMAICKTIRIALVTEVSNHYE